MLEALPACDWSACLQLFGPWGKEPPWSKEPKAWPLPPSTLSPRIETPLLLFLFLSVDELSPVVVKPKNEAPLFVLLSASDDPLPLSKSFCASPPLPLSISFRVNLPPPPPATSPLH